MPQVTVSPEAERDFVAIYAYIGADNPDAARRFSATVRRTFERLARSPLMGESYVHNPIPNLRRKLVSRYRNYSIYYVPTIDGIHVVRVIHNARDLPAVLDE